MSGDREGEFGSAELAAFAQTLTRLAEESGKAWAAYLRGADPTSMGAEPPANLTAAAAAFAKIAETLAGEPERAAQLQSSFAAQYLDLWTALNKRLQGEAVEAQPFPDDARFADPEWSQNPYFDFLRRTHLLTTGWTDDLLGSAAFDPATRARAAFYTREVLNAVSPSNYVLTNPVLLRETLESGGENLIRGLQRLSADLEGSGGELHVRQAEPDDFRVGETLATTPGKVVFRNELMELIQYAPSTTRVRKRPLLIVPPWINKFYILDLAPGKSFIEWAVGQGLTVFCISWVNPDATLRDKSFADYIAEGVVAATRVVGKITRSKDIDALGYCIGGTLLAVAAAKTRSAKDPGMASLTLLAAQLDFTDPGELKLFIDEPQLAYIEQYMSTTGFMDGRVMARVFNHLRSKDLVWPFMVDAYVRGVAPRRFALLFWNSDTTRVPAANHAFYLRQCYLENALAQGRMQIASETIDLDRLSMPVYAVVGDSDHIAPAASVFAGLKLLPGPVRFALAGSGHIAGIVNPPAPEKYGFRAGVVAHEGEETLDAWRERAEEQRGSWWPDWLAWLDDLDTATVKARKVGSAEYPPMEDAPGTYVHVR